MVRLIFIALTTGVLSFSFPVWGSARQPLNSQLSDMERALVVSIVRAGLVCREELEGEFTPNQIESIMQTTKVDRAEFLDPVVSILSYRFRQLMSADCRTIDKPKVGPVVTNFLSEYRIRFTNEFKATPNLTYDQFEVAVDTISEANCQYSTGKFKTKKEQTDYIGRNFKKRGIPISAGLNTTVQKAVFSVDKLIDNKYCLVLDQLDKHQKILTYYYNQL